MARRTKLLIDTNLFLEALLQRPRYLEVVSLFQAVQKYHLMVSHFTVDSIGLYLFRGGQPQLFVEWLSDLAQSGAFELVALDAEQRLHIANFAMQYGLDYDDAFQYAVAEAYDLVIVSFDQDFDGTPRGRKEPKDLL